MSVIGTIIWPRHFTRREDLERDRGPLDPMTASDFAAALFRLFPMATEVVLTAVAIEHLRATVRHGVSDIVQDGEWVPEQWLPIGMRLDIEHEKIAFFACDHCGVEEHLWPSALPHAHSCGATAVRWRATHRPLPSAQR
jgi:hypothetical protein